MKYYTISSAKTSIGTSSCNTMVLEFWSILYRYISGNSSWGSARKRQKQTTENFRFFIIWNWPQARARTKHVKIISLGGSRSIFKRFFWPLHVATLNFLLKGVKSEENCSFSGFRKGLRSTHHYKRSGSANMFACINTWDHLFHKCIWFILIIVI